jgi:hypothetical protein
MRRSGRFHVEIARFRHAIAGVGDAEAGQALAVTLCRIRGAHPVPFDHPIRGLAERHIRSEFARPVSSNHGRYRRQDVRSERHINAPG